MILFYIGSVLIGISIGIIIYKTYVYFTTTTGEFLVDTSDENVDRYTFRFNNIEELKTSKYIKCKVIHWHRSA